MAVEMQEGLKGEINEIVFVVVITDCEVLIWF